jgi:hypothetical protein
MNRLCLLLFFAAVVVAQDEDPHTTCGPQRGGHVCHCPRMVARRQAQHTEDCVKSSDTKAKYLECMRRMQDACDILETPDRDQDTGELTEEKCFKWCRLDLCFCNDMRCGPTGGPYQPPQPKAKKGRK